VQAIKLGASDYVTKPFLSPQFQGAIRRALSPLAANAKQVTDGPVKGSELVDRSGQRFLFPGREPAMKQIRAQAALIAKVNVPVLLLGESGVGKEILARLIHKMSIRAHRPIVKVNARALPADLLESELFGYEAGAFTGANKSKPGKFEMAHKGTILLDEIGEMSAALQAKLLHVLQDGTFSRLGGPRERIGRCPRSSRHQHRREKGHCGAQAARRSLLSFERFYRHGASVARAS